jgi:hypothetical protein
MISGRHLIYTAAHGPAVYLEMAAEMARSARRHGFSGDIRILADQDADLEYAQCSRVDRNPDLLAKAGLLRALRRHEIEAYDQVLFLDADCVFQGPVERIFRGSGLRVATQGRGASPGEPAYNLIFMTPEERQMFCAENRHQINTGMIRMPGKVAHEFLSAWEDFWRACPRLGIRRAPAWKWCSPNLMDQPALQALLMRSKTAWRPFARNAMGFPLFGPSEHATVLHFCGQAGAGLSRVQSKEVLLGRMREAAGGIAFLPNAQSCTLTTDLVRKAGNSFELCRQENAGCRRQFERRHDPW